jgi:UDP-N-acetylglucosamine transferase subunit ALG13
MPFDKLLEEVDRLAAENVFDEPVICQGGQSRYRISHGEQFVGLPSIADLIAESSMVITHGGLTVLQVLFAAKPFIAFPNPLAAGDHQTRLLAKIATVTSISWSRNILDLEQLFRQRRRLGPASISMDIPRAANVIRNALY